METKNVEDHTELSFWNEVAGELLKHFNPTMMDVMCAPLFEIVVAMDCPRNLCP